MTGRCFWSFKNSRNTTIKQSMIKLTKTFRKYRHTRKALYNKYRNSAYIYELPSNLSIKSTNDLMKKRKTSHPRIPLIKHTRNNTESSKYIPSNPHRLTQINGTDSHKPSLCLNARACLRRSMLMVVVSQLLVTLSKSKIKLDIKYKFS